MGLISNFGQWLDKKFPDKVVVTDASYQELRHKYLEHERTLIEQDVRIKNLCRELVDLKIDEIRSDLNKIKMAMGFKALGMEKQFQNLAPLAGLTPK